jgi:hypothetical protein
LRINATNEFLKKMEKHLKVMLESTETVNNVQLFYEVRLVAEILPAGYCQLPNADRTNFLFSIFPLGEFWLFYAWQFWSLR